MLINYSYILFMLPVFIFSLICQFSVKSTYAKYSKIPNGRRMTGAQAAERVIKHSGIYGVKINAINGTLTDHYDPRSNNINLSGDVFSGYSIASVGVAAHEAGHAVQHNSEYAFIKLRTALVPACNIGSRIGPWLILLGLALNMAGLYYLGLIGFTLVALFQLVTLPVEFNASRRALCVLKDTGMLNDEELNGARKVLRAAAMTYVAALASSCMQILYYLSIGNRRR